MATGKRGRPVSENPKCHLLRIRVDDTLLSKLDQCAQEHHVSRSEVVRIGIEEQYDKLQK